MRAHGWQAKLICAALLLGARLANAQAPLLIDPRACPNPPCAPDTRLPQAVPPTPKKDEAPSKKEETPTPPAPQPTEQPSPSDTSADLGGDTTSTFDSAVGYIDSAIPTSELRLRFDAAYGDNRPTRAEFFYPKGGPFGRGLPKFETNVDYQELQAYAEWAIDPRFSIFIEEPYRWLNPTVNDNQTGFSDLNVGFKYAFLYEDDTVASFQLRAYAPTGDPHLGLGTGHTSLEPALLAYHAFNEKFRTEAELRLWVPMGGTDFEGDIVRYGIGFSYGERPKDDWWLNPVVELVGWTVLNGKEQVAPPTDLSTVKNAGGDTIVNFKVGLRVGLGKCFDVYTGYGRPLTGDVWYKDIWRTELCIFF